MKRGIRTPVVALVAGVMAITIAAWPSAASALDKLTLKLAWTPYGPQGFLHLPVVNGWFKDAGLDVKIEDGAGSNKTIAYIGAKNYDIGFANVSSMAMAREKGLEVKVIMLMVRQSDFGVLVPKEKNVKTLKDIERMGLGIGYTAASMEGAFMDTFLRLGGTSRSKVKLVNIEPSAKISSYLSGTVDTILTSAPFIEPILRTKKPSTIVSFAQVGLPLPSNGVMAHVDTIASKKDQLRRFVKVVSRSVEYVMSGGGEDEIGRCHLQATSQRQARPLAAARADQHLPAALLLAQHQGQADGLAVAGGLGGDHQGHAGRWRPAQEQEAGGVLHQRVLRRHGVRPRRGVRRCGFIGEGGCPPLPFGRGDVGRGDPAFLPDRPPFRRPR